MDEKRFFRIGTTSWEIEYRASLAWEILKYQLTGVQLKEALLEKPTIATDLVDASFSLADTFVDKLAYRGDLRERKESEHDATNK